MRFTQLDKIVALQKGKSICAVKGLALSEEYLQDHFPRFPVMPGVLMLEAMFQASSWLVRASTEFALSSVALKESKSLKFQGFVQPGNTLEVFAEIKSVNELTFNLKVKGTINGETATSGRLVVEAYNLSERDGIDEAIDRYMNHQQRLMFRRLCDPLDPNNPDKLEKTSLVH
ncbi:MAG: 3-hydroxyacyl-ACP dehydratase FabZ family protein [Planctomycetota bacterium]